MMCQSTWRIWCLFGGEFIIHSSGFAWSDYQSSPFESNGSNFSECRVITQAFPLGNVANVWATQEAEGEHIATTCEKQCLLLLCVHAVKGVFRWYTSWQKVVGLLLNKREEKRTSTGTTHRMTRHGWSTNQRSALYPTKLPSTFFAGNLNGKGNLERVIITSGWALDGSELTTSTAYSVHPQKISMPSFRDETWVTKFHLPGWWFQIFFIFIPTWGNDPIWLIFFKWF